MNFKSSEQYSKRPILSSQSSYSVLNFGACGDGVTNDAPAVQKAIDTCHLNGGGTVVLDGGHTYYASSIILKSHVHLYLEPGSVLLASKDLSSYFNPNHGVKDDGVSRIGTPVMLKPSYAFLYAKDADDIAISGEGIIDGNCYAFVKRVSPYYVTGDFYPRPTMIYTEHCDHISFCNVTLKGAPFWTLHIAGCNDVSILGLRILNPLDVANSDGIDVDHSSNVRVLGCHIECADDTVCLKTTAGNQEYGLTQNVIISDCTLISTSAAIKIGTEGVCDFKNILIHHCIISQSNRGVSIQIRDGGNVDNVFVSDLIIETRRFSESWWGTAEPIAVTSFNRDENTTSGKVNNLRFERICCSSENGVLIAADDASKIDQLKFKDVQISLQNHSKWPKNQYDFRPGIGQLVEDIPTAGFLVRGVSGVSFENCHAFMHSSVFLPDREFVYLT